MYPVYFPTTPLCVCVCILKGKVRFYVALAVNFIIRVDAFYGIVFNGSEGLASITKSSWFIQNATIISHKYHKPKRIFFVLLQFFTSNSPSPTDFQKNIKKCREGRKFSEAKKINSRIITCGLQLSTLRFLAYDEQ